MKSNLISIVMPIYNAEGYLDDAIQSVTEQTYSEWELLCIDDCSTDNSANIVSKYIKDSRIKYFRLSENSGVAKARNFGLHKVKGKYVAFLDSDDVWYPNKLQRQIKFMESVNSVFSYTAYCMIDHQGRNLGREIYVPETVTYSALLRGNKVACSTVILNRDALGDILMPCVRHEDYATWLKILKRGYTGNGLNEILGEYRISAGSLTKNKLKSAMWTWNIYRNVEKLPLHKAIESFSYYLIHGLVKHYSNLH